MEKRKRIAMFVSFPETVHVCRAADGIMRQCEKYGYDLCVFSPAAHLSFPDSEYVKGESNIYDLANIESFDGFILDPITLSGDKDNAVRKSITEKLSN